MIIPDFLVFIEHGLYCKTGDFYLDPSQAVDTAVISHAHGDHACSGNNKVYSTPATAATTYTNASPLFAVTPTSVPTIILHGTIDNVVPISESDSLNNRLINAGVPKQYEKYTGEGHGFWSTANTADAMTKIASFIKLHVK